ncbi:MAG TPA: multiheme c-type cytochrome [Vicinamibacterales bacterium]|nr:multiheme c-type cytochrome [Vicinamibacterales bacterium]
MRRLRPFLMLASAAILFAVTLTTSLRAAAPARSASLPPQAAAADAGNYVGPGSCSAVACHGAIRPVAGARILQTEYSTWVSQDRHARATEVLGNTVSQRMGRILGIGNPLQAQKCLVCHSLDVPVAVRGRNFATEGVSCEACHGPATGWLGYHVTKDATHEESVKRGMYDTKDVVKHTDKCLTCHLGTSEKFVDHEMIAAGHPDLVFELEAFSAAMPRHWKETTDADAYKPVRTFAVGQLTHLRASLDRVARRVKGPIWPEYAELDCFACHHSLTRAEDSWRQAVGYENRARPGLPQLQVSRYLTGRRVLQAWDAQAATELDGVMAKLQIEASRLTARPDDVVALATQARGIVDRGLNKALTSMATAEMASSMLRGIFADAPSIAERGERAAEQAAMAVEVLATAMAKGRGQDTAGMKGTFTELFQQFESPSSYDPRRFTAAMKKAEGAIPNR